MSDRPTRSMEWRPSRSRSSSTRWTSGPSMQPVENLATYRDLVRFTELAGLVEPALAADPARSRIRLPRSQAGAVQLREHLHAVLSAVHKRRPVSQSDLDAIAAAIQAARAARVLVAPTCGKSRDPPLVPSDGRRHAAARVRACRRRALLMDVDRGRIRSARPPDCGVYFVDTSKGHRRQWCSMGNCGNREKQRRWRSGAR